MNHRREEMLQGATYKIKNPLTEHAMYFTVNDTVTNAGSENEQRRPYECFINTKNMEHFEWLVALTRIMSRVMREGGDPVMFVEELSDVFRPQGGYFKKGGKYMPSIVAEIGEALETHLKHIGMMEAPQLDEHQRALIEKKRAEYEARQDKKKVAAGAGVRP